jgi:hypothetical protein
MSATILMAIWFWYPWPLDNPAAAHSIYEPGPGHWSSVSANLKEPECQDDLKTMRVTTPKVHPEAVCSATEPSWTPPPRTRDIN